MYKEKQKIDNVTNLALSPSGKTLAIYFENDNIIKIYKLFNDCYELSKEILISEITDIAINDSMLLASSLFRNDVDIYIRKNNSWIKQTTLKPCVEDWHFGSSVAVNSNNSIIVVGAHVDNNYKGAVHIFTRSSDIWEYQTKLTASDGSGGDYFGRSVSIDDEGNIIVISAYGNNTGKGSAYVFVQNNNTWIEQTKLTAVDGKAYDWFGWSTTISSDGNVIVVGANGDNGCNSSAYVFTNINNKWIQEAKLTVKNKEFDTKLELSTAISYNNNTIAIGACGDDNYKGSVYVFKKVGNEWIKQTKLIASDGASGDYFGHSVTVSSNGNIILVEAYGDNDYNGSAYVFIVNNS